MAKASDYHQLLTELASVKTAIDGRLEELYLPRVAEASKMDPRYGRLLDDMRRFIGRGGKRLRPSLALVGYRAAGGRDEDAALDMALALEVFHNFTLIHDDIMDSDTRRYGGRNISGLYSQRYARVVHPQLAPRYGESVAILAGDINLSFSYQVLAQLEIPPQTVLALIRRLNETVFEVAGGQLLDLNSALQRQPSLRQIDRINQYKTAGYSFVSPLQMGIILAGGSPQLMEEMARFGRALGSAYQLTDDLLGVFGSQRVTGKPVGSDLREGKQTLLIYFGYKLGGPSTRQLLDKKLGSSIITEAEVKQIRQALEDCGAYAKTLITARQHADKALGILAELSLPESEAKVLTQLVGYCVERSR